MAVEYQNWFIMSLEMVSISLISVKQSKMHGKFVLVVCLNINNEWRRFMLEKFCFVSPANLTAHEDEKVGLENFELLKVLGTGGK